MKPVNRHLLVEIPAKEEKEDNSSVFLLPDSYREKVVERYTRVRIVACADDCKANYSGEAYVESSMIEAICIDEVYYHIVPENYLVLLLEA